MFRGRYFHTVDPKGRLSIPAKFREVLRERYDDKLIVANIDSCLVAYPEEEWARLEEKALQIGHLNRDMRYLMRVFFSSGVECPVDRAGRILLPPSSREYAGLAKDAVLVGAVNKFEIWGRQRWDDFMQRTGGSFDEIADKLATLGL